ncbi:MAG: diguanylate cyclase [Planctomycetota bacterium]
MTQQHANNPLHRLPSVLAMPDLQRRLSRVLREMVMGEDELVALLKLDPLAVVRGLRAAGAVVFAQASGLPTVRGIVRNLGGSLSKRLFKQPFRPVANPAELQQLWQHAIATAIAAEELAERTNLLDPEVAYLVGLLHDLPDWLLWLDKEAPAAETKKTATMAPTEWILQWQLPAPFVSLMLAVQIGGRARSTDSPPDPSSLIRAAELLAELAGFHHPGKEGGDPALEAELRNSLDRSQLLTVQRLHRRVEAALRSFGFAPDISEEEIAASNPTTVFDLSQSRLDEVVLSILGCMNSESYRGIVTALLAAGVRYGHYDRAFYAKWIDDDQSLILRSKADSSSRRMLRKNLQLGTVEADVLRRALATQTPQLMRIEGKSKQSLLRMLSTDELLVIPVNLEFATPAFLMLDRSLTLQPIDLAEDLPLATMLGMTGTLLNQNLLLRRSRQRAEKFALTDPLTRLFNRRMGIHALEQSISRIDRDHQQHSPLTVLMCDLDHFKQLNDTLGHAQGDVALRATADVLRNIVRKSDTVCRYGGEEFLVVLPDTTPDEATVLATRMFTAVHSRGEDLGLPMTISIGLTSYRPRDTVESMLLRADRALYASKGFGRNRFSADVEADDLEPVGQPSGDDMESGQTGPPGAGQGADPDATPPKRTPGGD